MEAGRIILLPIAVSEVDCSSHIQGHPTFYIVDELSPLADFYVKKLKVIRATFAYQWVRFQMDFQVIIFYYLISYKLLRFLQFFLPCFTVACVEMNFTDALQATFEHLFRENDLFKDYKTFPINLLCLTFINKLAQVVALDSSGNRVAEGSRVSIK